MQAAPDEFVSEARSQHDRGALDGIGAEDEEIAADLIFLTVMDEGDRTERTADMVEPSKLSTPSR